MHDAEQIKLLSVGIPTFNRHQYLEQVCNSLLGSLHLHNWGLLQLIIADNASTDPTPTVVKQLQATFPEIDIRYLRHSTNIGQDLNVMAVYSMMTAEYGWLWSDRRVWRADINILIQHLQAFAPDIVLFNSDAKYRGPNLVPVLCDGANLEKTECGRVRVSNLFGSCIFKVSPRVSLKEVERFVGTALVQDLIYGKDNPQTALLYNNYPFVSLAEDERRLVANYSFTNIEGNLEILRDYEGRDMVLFSIRKFIRHALMNKTRTRYTALPKDISWRLLKLIYRYRVRLGMLDVIQLAALFLPDPVFRCLFLLAGTVWTRDVAFVQKAAHDAQEVQRLRAYYGLHDEG